MNPEDVILGFRAKDRNIFKTALRSFRFTYIFSAQKRNKITYNSAHAVSATFEKSCKENTT